MAMAKYSPDSNAGSSYIDLVLGSLRDGLTDRVTALVKAGIELPEPDQFAEELLAAAPVATSHSEYDRLLGPFYSSQGAMRLLQIRTNQELADRRTQGTVLAAMTRDEVWVYPAFQFDVEHHCVHPKLAPILNELKSAPRWGASLWLVTPNPDLDGARPVEAADDANQQNVVVELARQYAAAIAA